MGGRIKLVQGTRDILPPETALWQRVEDVSRDIFRTYNFFEIRTPIFEDTQLFARGVGEETDIVSKEMFTWVDGGRISEKRLLDSWLAKHPDYHMVGSGIEPSAPDAGFDAVVRKGNHVYLIECKRRPETSTLVQLGNAVGRYCQGRPNLEVEGLLVVPHTGKPQFGIVSQVQDVFIEQVEGDFLTGTQSLTLRPENTAGVVRAYIEHSLFKTGALQKLYYIGPQFRRERPQKGRYRQFYQIGAEVLGPPSAGSESPARDAEIITMLVQLLDKVGIKQASLQLNSIGCARDRVAYNQALRDALVGKVDKMCQDCRRRAETNPLRVLDCKVPEDQEIIESLPRISQYRDGPCREHFKEVRAILDYIGIRYQINERMVRGLDYYTRTTFEFTHSGLGSQSALLGGGRYDGLSDALGGPSAPGIGFALGIDRFVLAIQAEGLITDPSLKPVLYVAPEGVGMNKVAALIANDLRKQSLPIEVGDETFRLKKSFEAAEKAGARFLLIVRENEVNSGQYALKNLSTGEQAGVARSEIAGIVQKK